MDVDASDDCMIP